MCLTLGPFPARCGLPAALNLTVRGDCAADFAKLAANCKDFDKVGPAALPPSVYFSL